MITHKTGSGRTYHHNGDFSGEVWVIATPEEVEEGRFADKAFYTVKIPTEDLIDIVGQYALGQRITELEDADPRDLLGLSPAV